VHHELPRQPFERKCVLRGPGKRRTPSPRQPSLLRINLATFSHAQYGKVPSQLSSQTDSLCTQTFSWMKNKLLPYPSCCQVFIAAPPLLSPPSACDLTFLPATAALSEAVTRLMFSIRYGTKSHYTLWHGCPTFSVVEYSARYASTLTLTRIQARFLETQVNRRITFVSDQNASFLYMISVITQSVNYPCNRPWRSVRFSVSEDPILPRQSTYWCRWGY
jgi:hypothetical protein